MNSASVVCPICKKNFKVKKNLYRHLRNLHKVSAPTSANLICPLCSQGEVNYSKLRQHITVHGIKLEWQKRSFENNIEFLKWKELIEKETKSSYVLSTRKILSNGNKKSYLSCNRSGSYASQSLGIRAPKAQGSCKMGTHCPSTIEMIEGKKISVVFHKTHVGHQVELKHITSNQSKKEELSRKLANGVPSESLHVHAVGMLQEVEEMQVIKDEAAILSQIDSSQGYAELSRGNSSSSSLYPRLKAKLIYIQSLLEKQNVDSVTGVIINRHLDYIISILTENRKRAEMENCKPANKKIKQ